MNKPDIQKLLDPKFYLENFTRIKGKTPGLIPFVLSNAQKDLFNTLRKANRVINLKCRQIGFSTACSGFLYHKTITTPGTTTALVAHKSEVATEFLDKIKTFWRTTPESIRPQIHFNSKYEMSFPAMDSKILVMSGENVGRGYTIHNVLASELALWEKPEEMMLALENAVPKDGLIVVESTPYGVGNLFHRMWAAENNGYVKREYGWWWHYSKEEVEEIRKRINDPLKFAQEYELAFLSSGRQVFESLMVHKLREKVIKVGEEVKLKDGTTHRVFEDHENLRIYKPPQEKDLYVVGVDVAEGVPGGDFSTAVIFNRSTGEEVAFFRGLLPADKFGERLNRWGRMYNNALMVVEVNNHGLTTITALKNLLYPSLYFRPAKFDAIGTQWSDRLGWKTTRVTRPLMIDDLNNMLGSGEVIVHSQEILDEMLTFIYDSGNNMVCMSGFHDDCIFATAIGVQGFKVLYDKPLEQIDYTPHLPRSTPY